MATSDNKTTEHASNVYLFKNGYGMIVKTFAFPPTTDANNASVELANLPANAVHGTFWIQSISSDVSIQSVRTKKIQKLVEKECLTVEDLVEANIGENVELSIVDSMSKDKEWISGIIKSVKRTQTLSDDDSSDSTSSLPELVSAHHPHRSFGAPSVPLSIVQTGNLVIVETVDNGVIAVPLSQVQSLRGASLKTTYQRKIWTKGLLTFYQNRSNANSIGLMKYLTHGLTWVPSYDIVLLSSKTPGEKKLRLSSKAVILNDIENVQVDNLFCIVGFPNISKFASVEDPIITKNDVRSFLEQLKQAENTSSTMYGGRGNSVMSNSVMTQQMMLPMTHPGNSLPDPNMSDADIDDLHLYQFRNVLLEKKERLILPIFEVELPYKDIYNCKIRGTSSSDMYTGYDEKKDNEEVWHSIEFDNASSYVWTTAPAVITKDLQEQQFIGQDKITYTLKGSSTFVNLTKALDVRVQFEEHVTNTDQSTFTLYRMKYKTNKIEGKLNVTNYKSENVDVVITMDLFGKVTNFSVPPKKDTIQTKNIDRANPQHEIRWEINVKAKEQIEIKYIRQFNCRA